MLRPIRVHMLVASIQIAITLIMVKDIVAHAKKGSKETHILNKGAKVK
jgi:hypothetical protein